MVMFVQSSLTIVQTVAYILFGVSYDLQRHIKPNNQLHTWLCIFSCMIIHGNQLKLYFFIECIGVHLHHARLYIISYLEYIHNSLWRGPKCLASHVHACSPSMHDHRTCFNNNTCTNIHQIC